MMRFVKEYAAYCKRLFKNSPNKKELYKMVDDILNMEEPFCKEFYIIKELTELVEQEAYL